MKDFTEIAVSQYRALLKEKESILKQAEATEEQIAKLKSYFSSVKIKTEEINNTPRKRGRPRKYAQLVNTA